MPKRYAVLLAVLAGISADLPAWALDAANSQALQQITVVGTTPVPGMTVDADKVPGNVQTLSSADLRQDGTSSLINGLSTRLGSLNINDALADAFQPNLLYRGFEASPVVGTPQGLAVYQNGVRINEAFGDTVNWDLFPDIAVSRVDIVSSNPLFGLNALGGAVSVTMDRWRIVRRILQPTPGRRGVRCRQRRLWYLCSGKTTQPGWMALVLV